MSRPGGGLWNSTYASGQPWAAGMDAAITLDARMPGRIGVLPRGCTAAAAPGSAAVFPQPDGQVLALIDIAPDAGPSARFRQQQLFLARQHFVPQEELVSRNKAINGAFEIASKANSSIPLSALLSKDGLAGMTRSPRCCSVRIIRVVVSVRGIRAASHTSSARSATDRETFPGKFCLAVQRRKAVLKTPFRATRTLPRSRR